MQFFIGRGQLLCPVSSHYSVELLSVKHRRMEPQQLANNMETIQMCLMPKDSFIYLIITLLLIVLRPVTNNIILSCVEMNKTYLTTMRRKKLSFVFSKTALFIPDLDLEKSGWMYLELRRIKEVFAWGCSLC